MEETKLVFVYGTLRKHERNHHILEDAACLAKEAWTKGRLYETQHDFPVMEPTDEEAVFGEVYRVSETILKELNKLEGYQAGKPDNLYDRIEQDVYTDTQTYRAMTYVLASQTEQLKRDVIPSGDWKVHQLIKQLSFLYFAYGSCMDDVRFKQQQADQHFADVLGLGVLKGYTLRFTRRQHDGGRADIVEEGGAVEGKIYRVTPEVLSYLYKREGVYAGIYRPAVVPVCLANGEVEEALTFIVSHKDVESAPPWHYMEEILRGGKSCCSERYLNDLRERYQRLKR